MNRTVNVHEAKSQLSRLLADVERGDEVIVSRAGAPVARLSALQPTSRERPLGRLAGQFTCPDDFDEFLAEEIAAEFGEYA